MTLKEQIAEAFHVPADQVKDAQVAAIEA